MGRRVLVELQEFVGRENVAVELGSALLIPEDVPHPEHNPYVQQALVWIRGTKQLAMTFDVTVSGSTILLEADYNIWGDSFEKRTRLLHEAGVSYRVV